MFRTITLAQNARCPMGIYLNILDQVQGNPIQSEISMRKESVSGAHSTRRATYVNLNPTMGQHGVYDRLVPEYSRKAFTRLRLSSHKLKMETGRWSRIPKEARRCPCGEIQTEEHMLLNCPHTSALRATMPDLQFTTLQSLFSEPNVERMALYIYKVPDKAAIP